MLTLLQVLERARSLEGLTLAEVVEQYKLVAPGQGVHAKGRIGELFEHVLGATGGSGQRVRDFPELELELKTIPIDLRGKPLESTFVCAVDLNEEVDYANSWVFRKLRKVLFLPVIGERRSASAVRTVGRAVLFEPTPEEDAALAADYDEIMGLVGIGRIEDVTAHLGEHLQIRPKARDGSARTLTFGREGEHISTVPRGFYLRTRFTEHVLNSR